MKIAIIPARGGSQRIPGKNKRLFHGKPIIQYSIELAKRENSMFDFVIVSTDDPEIRDIATSLGVTVHERSPELAQNDVGTQAVAAEVVRWAGNMWIPPEYACVIYPTAPMACAADLWRGLEQVAHKGHEFAFSVGTSPLRDAGQWYWGRGWAFTERRPLVSTYSAVVPIAEERVCDINVEAEWRQAEEMYWALYQRGSPVPLERVAAGGCAPDVIVSRGSQ